MLLQRTLLYQKMMEEECQAWERNYHGEIVWFALSSSPKFRLADEASYSLLPAPEVAKKGRKIKLKLENFFILKFTLYFN